MKKIRFISTEAVPLAKTGGLADVCGTLPVILKQQGYDASIIMPWYKNLEAPKIDRTIVELGNERRLATYGQTTIDGVEVILIKDQQFFNREEYYGTDAGPYPDNDRRFIFFSRAAVQYISRHDSSAIIHAHDWFTGLVPLYLRSRFKHSRFQTLFTIHNLQHQGIFPASSFYLSGLPNHRFSPCWSEYYGKLNLMKAGITASDRLTTVSPTYAEEIQTPQFGEGLEGVIREESEKLTGIINGIDSQRWNSETDPYLEEDEQFSASDISGKKRLKNNLLQEYGLKNGSDLPLIGTVSRLAQQKGIDLLLNMRRELSRLPARWIFLGTGEAELEAGLKQWESEFPGRVRAIIDFDEELAHRIVAASDIYCMPSRFEPCGLNQLYCSQYGTVPVVHRTGGLADTVNDLEKTNRDQATGFSFKNLTPENVKQRIEDAVNCYREQPEIWKLLQQNGFERDFSWERSADKYAQIYDSLAEEIE